MDGRREIEPRRGSGAEKVSIAGRLRERGVSRWPLSVVGVLLLIEALGLATAGTLELTGRALTPTGFESWKTSIGVSFLVISPLALVCGVGFLLLMRRALTGAMLLQGLSLAVCLVLYFYLSEMPWYLYLGMLYSTLLVYYLNSHDLRMAFSEREEP